MTALQNKLTRPPASFAWGPDKTSLEPPASDKNLHLPHHHFQGDTADGVANSRSCARRSLEHCGATRRWRTSPCGCQRRTSRRNEERRPELLCSHAAQHRPVSSTKKVASRSTARAQESSSAPCSTGSPRVSMVRSWATCSAWYKETPGNSAHSLALSKLSGRGPGDKGSFKRSSSSSLGCLTSPSSSPLSYMWSSHGDAQYAHTTLTSFRADSLSTKREKRFPLGRTR